jgi:peroxiredoxin Q/BCP
MQLCAVRDDWSKFQSAGIAVFGVNHADAESHHKFIKHYTFPFPLLIDAGKKISALYGATKPLFKATVIKRSVVGIDKDGVIRFLKRGMPKDNDILKVMKPA